jgi:hypothetical protein
MPNLPGVPRNQTSQQSCLRSLNYLAACPCLHHIYIEQILMGINVVVVYFSVRGRCLPLCTLLECAMALRERLGLHPLSVMLCRLATLAHVIAEGARTVRFGRSSSSADDSNLTCPWSRSGKLTFLTRPKHDVARRRK